MSRPFVVFIEPEGVFYRYLDAVRRRFRTLVLTNDYSRCLAQERKMQIEMDRPNESQIDLAIECDVTSVQAMLDVLRPMRDEIVGVLPGDDPFVPVAAQVGTRLGFYYANDDDATAQQLKSAMKLRLRERGVRTAPFQIAHNYEEALHSWETLGRDAVIKMVDFLGSLNVSRVRTESELRAAWESIILDRHQAPTPFPLAKEALVEAFIAGRELSIEGYAQNGRCVVLNYNDKISDPHFMVVGHYLPAQVTQEESDALAEIAADCVKALGIRNSVFHIEVNLRDGVPFVIESASRPPGQYMVDLMQKAYGIDLLELSVRLAIGETVTDRPQPPQRYYAMLVIYSERTGVFQGMKSWDLLCSRPGVLRTFIAVKPGEHVVELSTFQDRYGFVILEDDSPYGVREHARWFRENVHMTVDCSEQISFR